MKHLSIKHFTLAAMLFIISVGTAAAQVINTSIQYGSYDQSPYPGYGDAPGADGVFYAAAVKTSGVIPPGTAQIIVSLAPELPWSGAAITPVAGWELDVVNSTEINLVFFNTADWTNAEDPFWTIPVHAIAARSTTAANVGVQVINYGGDWFDPSPLDNYLYGTIQVNDVNLPVLLTYFSANKENTTALLTWATTWETNSDHFEVERSSNAKNWNKIGTVASHGESTTTKNYSFSDATPITGTNYYRLKMVDKDATFAYSSIKSAEFAGAAVSVYPNPASSVVYLKDIEAKNVKEVAIINASGVTAYKSGSVSESGINVGSLNNGIYIIKVTKLDGTASSHKIVISK